MYHAIVSGMVWARQMSEHKPVVCVRVLEGELRFFFEEPMVEFFSASVA